MSNETKKAREPILVRSRNCHAACDEGISKQGTGDHQADQNCGYDAEPGAYEVSYGSLFNLMSAEKLMLLYEARLTTATLSVVETTFHGRRI